MTRRCQATVCYLRGNDLRTAHQRDATIKGKIVINLGTTAFRYEQEPRRSGLLASLKEMLPTSRGTRTVLGLVRICVLRALL